MVVSTSSLSRKRLRTNVLTVLSSIIRTTRSPMTKGSPWTRMLGLGFVLFGFTSIVRLLLTSATDLGLPHALLRQPTTTYLIPPKEVPLGSLGPTGTDREHLHYYDEVYYRTLHYGQNAKSLLEVGCSGDTFIKYVESIPDKTCIAPYRASYEGGSDHTDERVRFLVEDFSAWTPDADYDVLVCSQVVEHVTDPKRFIKKLIQTANVSIISVPYKWKKKKHNKAHHVTHNIDLDLVMSWTAPIKPTERFLHEVHRTFSFQLESNCRN